MKNLDYTIHPNDEMITHLLNGGRDLQQAFCEYMLTGCVVNRIVQNILELFGRSITDLSSLLDFASGYGRLTRFLIRDIDPLKVTISEIDPEAVNFQINNFGVNGIVSNEDPKQLELHKTFDVIICISLFSHLPKKLFLQWLVKLINLCNNDGLLIFTTHSIYKFLENSRSISKFLSPSRRKGFIYFGSSETERLDSSVYGTSYVSYDFVEKIVKRYSQKKIVTFIPRGLDNHQDIYVIGPSSERRRELKTPVIPCGHLDSIIINDDQIMVSGWGYDLEYKILPEKINLYVNGIYSGCAQIGAVRDDVTGVLNDPKALNSGFHFSCKLNSSLYSSAIHINSETWHICCAEIVGQKYSNILCRAILDPSVQTKAKEK